MDECTKSPDPGGRAIAREVHSVTYRHWGNTIYMQWWCEWMGPLAASERMKWERVE